jgi:small subunit ribosomal protein S18
MRENNNRNSSRNSEGRGAPRNGGGGFGGGNRGGAEGQDPRGKVFFRRKRNCPLSEKNSPAVDYKDVRLLGKFISEHGKILPRRITSVRSLKQRELAVAIKRARVLGLLPYVNR